MRRNKAPPPQDKMSNNNNNLNQYSADQVDDSTPNRIRPRTTTDMNNNNSNRSRYEIDHGSADYNSHPLTSNSPLILDDSQRADSPGSHSSKDGLHHRKSHHANTYNNHPIQHLSHPLATNNNNQQSSSLVHHNTNRNSQQQQRSRIKSNNHLPSHLQQRSRSSVGNSNSQKVIWKRVIQCIFIALIVVLAIVYVLLHNKVHNQQSINKHENEKIDLPWGSNNMQGDYTVKDVTNNNGEAMDSTEGQSIGDERSPRKMFNNNNRQSNKSPQDDKHTINHEVRIPPIVKQTREKRVPAKPQDYIFKSIPLQQPTNYNPSSTSNNNEQTIQQWSQESIKKAQTSTAKRRKSRKLRTSRHLHNKLSSSIPKWNELHHDLEGTIQNIQDRWSIDDNDKVNGDESESRDDIGSGEKVDISSLCGLNTQAAASQHPLNYLHSPNSSSHQPLTPNSRILITGILSPLGLHLAIALYRQCSITNFIGLDVQFPNDPMNRLEQLERWSVLKQELENVDLIVPFLGLEVKSSGSDNLADIGNEEWVGEQHEQLMRQRREKELVKLRDQATKSHEETDSKSYTKPYTKYGIPLTPGTTKTGSGPLDIILSYRPTHIVHLAGTQSDSLLNSNYHQGGTDESHESTVFQNKEEEEDDILIESISSRPHLFDLRMGMTGMEQLLSGVVAQTMIPPLNAYDPNGNVYKETKKELAKMKRPHVVYASSYDALHFRDMAHHLNKKKSSKRGSSFDEEESVLGHSISQSPQPKRPPRGLHGVSRLIDELIASSYFALHDIPSVGLRFDAIYGPRGFGVPSTSVPIFHSDRIKPGRTLKRGVSPDVDLAETAVRNLYKGWSSEVKIKLDKEAEEEQGDDDEEEDDEENRRRRRWQQHTTIYNQGKSTIQYYMHSLIKIDFKIRTILLAEKLLAVCVDCSSKQIRHILVLFGRYG